ncbi:uncharacterized protein involved in exopolysaccharide biosynthesis [Variovorax boronicumulans]|uniref:GumC family protein n=1 Tax=Variovorax boronicumulans TaxID=436515 RepID=UPI00339762F2
MAAAPFLYPERDPSKPPAFLMADAFELAWLNRWLISGSVLLVTALSLGLYVLQPSLFTSTARVLVQTDQIGTPSFLSGIAAYRESQVAEPVGRKIETEMALILNRQNAIDVVDELNIHPSHLPGSSIAGVKQTMVGAWHRWTDQEAPQEATASNVLVDAFLSSIIVEPVRSKTAETTSNVLEIKLEATDPELAASALGKMLDAYLQVGAQQNRKLGIDTTDLLKAQIEQAKLDVAKSEEALVAQAVRESEQATLTASVSSSTGAGLSGQRGAGRTSNEAATSQLMSQLVDLQAQLEELRQTFTDETESVRKLKRRVDETRSRVAAQVRASAKNTAVFNRLDRQRSLAQDHYVELRRKLEQIDLYMKLTPAALDGRIVVAPPSLPGRNEAHKKKSMAMAGPIAGFLLGLLLAALREFMRPRIHTRRGLKRVLGMPALGTVPSFQPDAPRAPLVDTRNETR